MNSATANPDCSLWTNSASWNDTVKEGLMNFALASMDALVYPFFWTWKVSSVLICYLGGALGATVPLSWFWSTIGLAFTFARAPVSVVFCLCYTTGPENNSHLYFSPSLRLHDLLFFIAMILLVPRRRMRCRVPAQVTAFHASPCKYLGFIFPKLIGTFPSQPTPGRASVEVLKSFHFLVMVSFLFCFSCFSPRAGMHHISISGMAGTLSDIRLLCWVVL